MPHSTPDALSMMLLAGALVFVPLALFLAIQALRKMDRPAPPPVPAAHGPRRRGSSSRHSPRRVNFGKRF